MKKSIIFLFAIIIFLFVQQQVFASTPTIIQNCNDQTYQIPNASCTLPGNMGSGNTIIATAYTGGTGENWTISGCGNTWTSVYTNSAANPNMAVWTSPSTSGSACTPTIVLSPNNNYSFLNVMEVSGVGSLDVTPAVNNPSFCATCSSASLTTATPGDLVFLIGEDPAYLETYSNFTNGFNIFGQGTSNLHGQGSGAYVNAYLVKPTAGSISTAWNITTPSGIDDSILMAFKPSSGGSGDITPPSVPTSLSASAQSSSSISLTWTASTDNVGVTGYTIYRGGVQIGTSATNSYSDTGLTASTQYTYTVDAYDAAGNHSSQSSSASATTQAVVVDTTPPSTPTNLSASAVSSSAINLSWTASTDNVGVTGYKIYRGGVQVGTSATNSYSDSGLSASTLYSYTVSAYDAAGNNSSQSSSASATTQVQQQAGSYPWSGILSPSRAIDWSKSGLPSNITYGSGGSACNGTSTNCVETTINAWTPPTRTQSGSTVNCANNTGDASTINTALAAAKPGSYVLLGNTTCNINANINLKSGVTLRGSGAMSTILNWSASATIQVGNSSGFGHNGPLSGSYSAGATSVTIKGGNDSGSGMVGTIARLSQCDTGFTVWGSFQGCNTGSAVDNGGLFITDANAINPPNSHQIQVQMVYVTAVTGNCTDASTGCAVTFTPALSMPNWSSATAAHLEWGSGGTNGAGLEDLSIILPSPPTANTAVSLNGYGSWVKGVRVIGPTNGSPSLLNIGGVNNLLMSNYFFGQGNNYTKSGDTEPVGRQLDTASLILNNIMTGGEGYWGNGYLDAEVLAYNYSQYDQAVNSINNIINHGDGTETFTYLEGNEVPLHHLDNNHVSNDLVVDLRNYFSGSDGPFWNANPVAVDFDNYQRFASFIGNVLGSSIGAISTTNTYQGTRASNTMWVIPNADTLALVSALRWGNCDMVSSPNCRFLGSEVPTSTVMPASTYPNAVTWQNPVPANDNIPVSFYMNNLTAHSNGGTGLSWWKVCTNWSNFPTSCASTQTQPFPTAGPDVTGGPYVNGHAYDIPTAVAFKNLPIDTSQQTSYTIVDSSWSPTSCASEVNTVSGPCEILTVNVSTNLTNGTYHVVGPFRLSGLNSACLPTSGPSYTGRPDSELLMEGNTQVNPTQITVVYSLGSGSPDNGSSNQCTGGGSGTFLWPDIRQFDERVYETDNSVSNPDTTPPSVPQSLSASPISVSSISLSWSPSSDNVGVTGYNIYRGGVKIGTSLTNSYSDTGLSASTLYTYTVSAYDAAGNSSAQSSSASATTQSAPTPVPGDLNLDHIVNSLDFSLLNSKWNTNYPAYDLYPDGIINSLDYAVMSSNWGKTW